jgi:hypothetical protein
MAISRLPRLRGLAGVVALIGATLIGLAPAQALGSVTPSVPPVVVTAHSVVPAGAAAAVPHSAAAAVPPAAAAAIPSSAAAAVPAAADGAAIASHVLSATNGDPAGPPPAGGSGTGSGTGSNPSSGATQPDPSPVVVAQALAPGVPATPTPPTADPAGSMSTSGAGKTSTTGTSAATHWRRPPGPPRSNAPVPTSVAASAPRSTALAIDPTVPHSALRAAKTTAEMDKRAGSDRRSRSPRPAAVDPSPPASGLLGASGSLPPAGAATGGTGTGLGSPAATLLTLVALSLLGALLPGLLGLEVGPWRSARCTLRLERPG